MKYQGRAFIRANGREWPTLEGSTLNPGGVNRNVVKGARVLGYQEEPVEATLECKLAYGQELNLLELRDLVDATVEFEADTGQVFMLANAWTTEPPTLTDKGEVDMKMAAVECKEA
ncbi:phage tail protein [Zobellella denitrificans]|uniref:Phage tail protein n=1 Tax=Zobellella denitrificans TaxID=347534 RepID=A0A291HQ88_9GAMM|nr:phage tail tube protein [Zobellella denitrificans]ATG74327.1 phage tail protein [Zobellella denitrificans]ATG74443.1 phage tail protein [Zobellella denitrificans]